MPSDALKAAVEKDHDSMRKHLKALVNGEQSASDRDTFLDEWVADNAAVGLVLFDSARSKLEGGDDVVDGIREDLTDFQQKFADLENADDDLESVAKRVAPAFTSQLDRVMREVVEPLAAQLDDDDVDAIAKRYKQARSDD